ncbi:MAG TPA: acyl carrier protein [Mycobacteriales bacterium]|jgi:acyl carrier protein|nr:acyl carrier protein [Mycobacteriales bacterium]
MNPTEATAAVAAALGSIAPEVDIATVDGDAPFREEMDLDSLDFLNLVELLHDSTGVEIREDDYARVGSLTTLVDYLVSHSPVATGA